MNNEQLPTEPGGQYTPNNTEQFAPSTPITIAPQPPLPKKSKKQKGLLIVLFIILGILALGGAAFGGYMYGTQQKTENNDVVGTISNSQASHQSEDVASPCKADEDEYATKGVFCSEKYGIKFKIPELFKNKLEEQDNTPIVAALNNSEQLGTTDSIVSTSLSQGQYKYTLTVSLLPQIDTMSVGVFSGQFNLRDKKVYEVTATERNPSLHRGNESPLTTSNSGAKVYRTTYGDVGHMIYSSVIITRDKVVVIDLRAAPTIQQGLPDETPIIDDQDILDSITLL